MYTYTHFCVWCLPNLVNTFVLFTFIFTHKVSGPDLGDKAPGLPQPEVSGVSIRTPEVSNFIVVNLRIVV